jgi:uncharacterized protein (DUF2236 family)
MEETVPHHPEDVTADGLERELDALRPAVPGGDAGVFGPGSMTWRIDREAATFLGAGRALLLQLAHPWVAAAVAEHSRTLGDPVGRFHGTFNIVFTMIFGTLDQAFSMARRLHRRHAAVTGVLPSAVGPFPAGTPYRANDPSTLAWVAATLAETAVTVHERVIGPLSELERDAFHRENRRFGALFGVPEAASTSDWPAFRAYNEGMWDSEVLTIGPEARRLAQAILSGAGTRLAAPSWYLAVTAHLLPERLRRGYGLAYGPAERSRAERALSWAGRAYPLLPARLRYVGPYQEALARLGGRAGPDLPARFLNRLWIGRQKMEP